MSERIISLTSENIKRLKAIHITPNGQSVEIAGRNGAGKSSVLDSIWYALAGRSVLPDRPIRDGESRAEVTVELENYTVTRSFTAAGGGTLKVTPKATDGKPIPSPQSFLDGLLSTLTFDPFEFTRLKDSEQGETLRKLLGLDFSAQDSDRQKAYNARTDVNRNIEYAAIKLKDWPIHPGLDEAPWISISDVMELRRAAIAHNDANSQKRKALLDGQQQLRNFTREEGELRETIISLEARLVEVRARLDEKHKLHQEYAATVAPLLDEVGKLQDRDLRVFDEQILKAEDHNAKLKRNRERAEVLAKKREWESTAAGLTGTMAAIDEDKAKALAAAKFPLPGLSFSSSGGVAYNGVPFSQISTAEQIRVSTAIGLSLNPGLKVIFIRNGSLIDDDGIRTLCALAQSHGAQIWIERVGALSGELPGVVIEDGAVSESTIGGPFCTCHGSGVETCELHIRQ